MMGEKGVRDKGLGWGSHINCFFSDCPGSRDRRARASAFLFLHKAIFDPSRPIASIKMPIKRVLCLT